jgi:hypothetical protein
VEGTCTHTRGIEKGSGRLRAQAEGRGGVKRGGRVKGPVRRGGDRVKRGEDRAIGDDAPNPTDPGDLPVTH